MTRTTKKEPVLHWDNLEEVQRLHSYLTELSDSKEISKTQASKLLQQLEFSRIDTLANVVSLHHSRTI